MPNNLGDLLKWLPFIKAIRNSRQDAEVSILANRHFTPLLEAFQVADQVLGIPKRNAKYYRRFLNLRRMYPDTYYQLTQSASEDLEARLINAPRRYGIRWSGLLQRKARRYSQAMLTEIYIEALLVDEELADQVW